MWAVAKVLAVAALATLAVGWAPLLACLTLCPPAVNPLGLGVLAWSASGLSAMLLALALVVGAIALVRR